MRKLKLLLITAILFVNGVLFGISVEKPTIKGAEVSVDGYPKPMIGLFSNENVNRGHNVLATNRRWYHKGWTNQKEKFSIPRELLGLKFYVLPVQEELVYRVHTDGDLYALAPCNKKLDRTAQMEKIGFKKVESIKPFQMFGKLEENIVCTYYRKVKKGDSFKIPRPWVFVAGILDKGDSDNGEVLYNGITIPRQWPPNYKPNKEGKWWPDGKRPMPVPYLKNKPSVINISVGRQLFVDDFLISKGDFDREYHQPKKYKGNPVLKVETKLEKGKFGINGMAGAAPKDGGVWWNPDKQQFEVWYETGWCGPYAFATSKDGLKWERPNLNIYNEPNQVFPDNMHPDSGGVVLDYQSADPKQRYKMFNRGGGDFFDRCKVWTSPDGIHWSEPTRGGVMGDRSTMFYNPFRKKWVYSLRWGIPQSKAGRARSYVEANDFVSGSRWAPEDVVYWLGTDELDPMRPEIKDSHRPQLYNFNAVAYESIMLGFYEILWGPDNDTCAQRGHPKFTGLNFAYSRDGFHWSRPDRRPAIDSERTFEKWDNGYVQSVGGLCTIHDDTLYIYYIAFSGDKNNTFDPKTTGKSSMLSGMYHGSAMGVAFLRRDGFVSINSKKDKPAEILTEPVIFAGSYLFANIDAPKGALYAEVVDMNGKVIAPFSFANCIPAKGDNTRARISWKGVGKNDLARLANTPVRFRFKMENGKFYSFWVSVANNGRSDGYVGGGGKGFYTNIDNVGDGN